MQSLVKEFTHRGSFRDDEQVNQDHPFNFPWRRQQPHQRMHELGPIRWRGRIEKDFSSAKNDLLFSWGLQTKK